MKERLTSFLKNKSNLNLLIILLVFLGVFLIFFSPTNKKEEKNVSSETNYTEYSKNLEEKIEKIAESITGKEVTATVTLETGNEYVYLDETKTDTEKNEQTYIIVKDDSGGEKALLVTERMPEIRGVVVIAKGASVSQCESIKESLQALLNIRSSKICVLKSEENFEK